MHRRKKGRRLVVLAAWQGIKVNERAGATYYFSPLGFYVPLARALVILPPPLPLSIRLVLVGLLDWAFRRSPSRQNRTAGGTRGGKRRKQRRSREEDGGRTEVQGVRGRYRGEGGRGERKGSQEKGEVADLELPRSSGRLHPASSCARREKSAGTLFTSTACTRARARAADGGFAKSFKFVRNAGPSCSKDANFDRRQARRLPAASPRNSRNRTLSAMLARSRRFSRKSPTANARFREIFSTNVILSSFLYAYW